jgi:hypothetical protein
MSNSPAQRQILHTIKAVVEAALMADGEASVPCIAAIALECAKYMRTTGEYGLIAREIEMLAQRWCQDAAYAARVHMDAKE